MYEPKSYDFSCWYKRGLSDDFEIKYSLEHLMDHLHNENFKKVYVPTKRDQPYHLELWVEKNTMNEMLRPVCNKYNAVLVTFKGNPSWGAAWKLCKRAEQDKRPTIVLYISDMDAYGFTMARQLCDKIAELNKNFFEEQLNTRVRRIGLTPEQVVKYNIPLVDVKERSDGRKMANLEGYTQYVGYCNIDPKKKAELDALERYYPEGVAGLATEWLSRYYDEDLEDKCEDETIRLLSETEDYQLPPEIIEQKKKAVSTLESLLKLEMGMDVPDAEEVESNVNPETENPDNEKWLLDTTHNVYPAEEVDCVD